MQLSARPLLDNAADQALFAGRDPLLRRIDRSLRTGLNCVVVGDPGSGKTSLVRALMYRADASGDPVHFSYLRAVDARSATDLLGAAVAAVTGRDRGEFGRRSAIELVDELGAAVAVQRESTPGRRVIVVEDVLARAGAEVFGSLRDELWQYVDAQWLVTTSTAQAPGLLRPPADVFFEIRIEIAPLTTAESREILRRRTGPDDVPIPPDVLAAAAAADTPRRLLDLARELSADRAVGGLRLTTLAGLRDRAAALEQVGRPARMLAQVLEVLGWASASDERLLDRMGWTRPRVVQVMAELEGRGLVQMREESTGRGRPRKLYRLTPASEFTDAASGGTVTSGGSAAAGGTAAGTAAAGGTPAPDGVGGEPT